MSEGSFFTTGMAPLVNWARHNPLSRFTFLSSCCAVEYLAATGPHYDLSRLSGAFPCIRPEQADLLMVVGTVNMKSAPRLRQTWEQMSSPKWVVAVGACACSGGCFENYATVPGIDHIVPVDLYVPGCPPRPEQIIHGLIELQERIRNGTLRPR